METIPKSAGIIFNLSIKFREQHRKLARISRKFRSIKTWCICNKRSFAESKEFNMTSGMPATL
jgi:hypothetical protein